MVFVSILTRLKWFFLEHRYLVFPVQVKYEIFVWSEVSRSSWWPFNIEKEIKINAFFKCLKNFFFLSGDHPKEGSSAVKEMSLVSATKTFRRSEWKQQSQVGRTVRISDLSVYRWCYRVTQFSKSRSLLAKLHHYLKIWHFEIHLAFVWGILLQCHLKYNLFATSTKTYLWFKSRKLNSHHFC